MRLISAHKATIDAGFASLDEEVAEAEGFNDLGRAERLRRELEFLNEELSAALGAGGATEEPLLTWNEGAEWLARTFAPDSKNPE